MEGGKMKRQRSARSKLSGASLMTAVILLTLAHCVIDLTFTRHN